MNEFTLTTTQYKMDTGEVTMHVTHPFAPGGFHLFSPEEALIALLPDGAGENWGNREALLIGQQLLEAHPVYGGPAVVLRLAAKRVPVPAVPPSEPAPRRFPRPVVAPSPPVE